MGGLHHGAEQRRGGKFRGGHDSPTVVPASRSRAAEIGRWTTASTSKRFGTGTRSGKGADADQAASPAPSALATKSPRRSVPGLAPARPAEGTAEGSLGCPEARGGPRTAAAGSDEEDDEGRDEEGPPARQSGRTQAAGPRPERSEGNEEETRPARRPVGSVSVDAAEAPAAFRFRPKAELHLHLEGSVRAATLVSLARRARSPLFPTSPAVRARQQFDGLSGFFSLYPGASAACCAPLRTLPSSRWTSAPASRRSSRVRRVYVLSRHRSTGSGSTRRPCGTRSQQSSPGAGAGAQTIRSFSMPSGTLDRRGAPRPRPALPASATGRRLRPRRRQARPSPRATSLPVYPAP